MTNGDGILAGKTVVVTGGGRGIGKMITTGLVEVGANVHICGRKRAELEALAEELSPIGKATTFVADLANPDDIYPFAEHVGDQGPHLHALVNNAGANWGAPVDTFPAAAWDRVLNVNLRGLFAVTQALLPLLRAASTPDDPARIVNVGSSTAYVRRRPALTTSCTQRARPEFTCSPSNSQRLWRPTSWLTRSHLACSPPR